MKRLAAIFALAFAAHPSSADEVSKNAGVCAATMRILGDDLGYAKALGTAPNQQLARNMAIDYVRRAQADRSSMNSIAAEGVRACSSIGLRPSSLK